MPVAEKIFLIQTLLYLMDYESKNVTGRLCNCLDELLVALDCIYDTKFAEVQRIYRLAEPRLWEYYEIAGITGQREQELINAARKENRAAIRSALAALTQLQADRVKASRAERRAKSALAQPAGAGRQDAGDQEGCDGNRARVVGPEPRPQQEGTGD